MPTGYTHLIEEGCNLEEFVWACARAFGACVMMRDDSVDKPVPEKFEPSDSVTDDWPALCERDDAAIGGPESPLGKKSTRSATPAVGPAAQSETKTPHPGLTIRAPTRG